jgi:hypothetical protein
MVKIWIKRLQRLLSISQRALSSSKGQQSIKVLTGKKRLSLGKNNMLYTHGKRK